MEWNEFDVVVIVPSQYSYFYSGGEESVAIVVRDQGRRRQFYDYCGECLERTEQLASCGPSKAFSPCEPSVSPLPRAHHHGPRGTGRVRS